jgi:hypothetical protein
MHIDNQAALKTLRKNTAETEQVRSTRATIDTLANVCDLRLYWTKAHVGTRFNERADELAKEATTRGIVTYVKPSRSHLKTLYKKAAETQWRHEWASSAGTHYGRTRLWFPYPDRGKTDVMLRSGRLVMSMLVQCITGFCNLMRHRHKKNPELADTCRLCELEPETPEHLTFHCPRLTRWRTDNFRTLTGTPNTWRPDDLINFLRSAPIQDLLVDNTDYGPRNNSGDDDSLNM